MKPRSFVSFLFYLFIYIIIFYYYFALHNPKTSYYVGDIEGFKTCWALMILFCLTVPRVDLFFALWWFYCELAGYVFLCRMTGYMTCEESRPMISLFCLYMCNKIWVDIDNLDLGQVLSIWHYGKVEHTHGNMSFASTY